MKINLKKYLKPLKLMFESDLERAIRKEEFVFLYQPEIDLKTKKIVGVEALLRWQHPSKGMINPGEFIPLLEKSGLIVKLTPFLLRQTLSDLKKIHQAGFSNLNLAINLSVLQLSDEKLPQMISKALQKADINPHFLECEITETAVFEDVNASIQMLQSILQTGVRLSIDDFGAGYAGFNYLRQLQVSKLKIDMEFLASLFEHKNNEIILSALIELGHKLNLQVLSEGVETKKQADWIMHHNCDLAQGYYYSRPLTIDKLITLLNTEKKAKK